jgi:hypothetical protein
MAVELDDRITVVALLVSLCDADHGGTLQRCRTVSVILAAKVF